MRAGLVIVREAAGQDAAPVPFAENENVIQTLGRIEPMRRSAKPYHELTDAILRRLKADVLNQPRSRH